MSGRSKAPNPRVDGWDEISADLPIWEEETFKPDLQDVKYHTSAVDGIAKITINRPELHNAFRPRTVLEMSKALTRAQDDTRIGVIVLIGEGDNAFCSGEDQSVRGEGGYDDGSEDVPRLRVLDLQVQMRRCPKPVIAAVAGYAIGGGHILHMVCDITVAADNAVFGQTGPRVGSFDAGYGSSVMARLVGQKKAREIWFLSRFYDANEALSMGLVNAVVPLARLEGEVCKWCRRIMQNSPTAIACLKAALNADMDGAAGVQELAGNATRLFYLSQEGKEGKNAFMEKRKPRFRDIPSSKL